MKAHWGIMMDLAITIGVLALGLICFSQQLLIDRAVEQVRALEHDKVELLDRPPVVLYRNRVCPTPPRAEWRIEL